jgi:hypothetical protein
MNMFVTLESSNHPECQTTRNLIKTKYGNNSSKFLKIPNFKEINNLSKFNLQNALIQSSKKGRHRKVKLKKKIKPFSKESLASMSKHMGYSHLK